jgi:uncharacterized protein YyaL (SSP411 family)
VLGQLRSREDYPATEAAVELALLRYSTTGHRAHLDLAASLARRHAEGAVADARPLFRVALAGGPTLVEAEETLGRHRDRLMALPKVATVQTASFALDLFARAAASRTEESVVDALLAAMGLMEARALTEKDRIVLLDAWGMRDKVGFHGYLRAVETALQAGALAGSRDAREHAAALSREMIRSFWDKDAERFRVHEEEEDLAPWAVSFLNAEAARVLWEVGFVNGDTTLQNRARRALDTVFEAALQLPEAAPAAALAAARLESHPVQMVLIGPPRNEALMDLRHRCYFLFEPLRVMFTLDPDQDAVWMEEMGYPSEFVPALYICVETLCSPPIQTADAVEGTVREIKALAAKTRESR